MRANHIYAIILLNFLLLLANSVRISNKKVNTEIQIQEYPLITYDLSLRESNSAYSLISTEKNEDEVVQILKKKTTEYSGIVKIGNPPQEFKMVFDTGSANFLITSSKCSECNHNKYDSSLSSTWTQVKRLNKFNSNYVTHSTDERDEVYIKFGTGNVKCVMSEDKVCLGKNHSSCVSKLLILEAFYESPMPFESINFDGIIGLSFTHLSIDKKSNFVDMLVQDGKIKKKMFSFYFNKDDKNNSQIHLGGISKKKFTGDIYWSSVISTDYWEIKIDSIFYGDEKLDFCDKSKCTAIVDTGTSMIAGPSKLISSLHSASYVEPDCTNFNILKNIKFGINGLLFNLDPEFYVEKYQNNLNQTRCANNYMKLDAMSSVNKTTLLLGIPFLKKYYTVFDRERSQIGFAVSNHQ